MKSHQIAKTSFLALATVLLLTGAVRAQPHGDQLVGNVVNMEGGGTAPVVIHIDHYSSDQEIANLKGVLAAQGPQGLRDALWNLEAGYIRIKGGLGYPVAAASSRPEAGGGRVVRLMIDRPLSFREEANSLRSVDYPFSYVEIHLDANGKGDGKLIVAAKVKLDGNTVDVESLGVQPFKLLDVHSR
jgi:hypothetical protein